MNELQNVYRLRDFSDYEYNKDITHSKLHHKSILAVEKNRHIIMNTISIPNKYIFFIQDATHVIELDDRDYDNYRFQPKKFCLDKWGDVELWSLLLKVNNMLSVTDFDSRRIRIFNPDIFEILNEMLILEQDAIDRNEDRISKRVEEIVND